MKAEAARGITFLQANPVPLFLTGLMGVGKTTLGEELAQLTQRIFIDTDQLIAARTGLSIPEIFASRGEAGFRQLEREAVAQACQCTYAIVALGGGALMDEDNLKRVLATGPLVHLTADASTLAERLAAAPEVRPLLARLDQAGIQSRLSELLAQRAECYARAGIAVSTTGRTPRAAAEALLAQLGEAASRFLRQDLKIGPYSCPILIGADALQELPRFLASRKSKKVFVISDEKLAQARQSLLNHLSAQGFAVSEIPVQAGEALKDIQTVYPLYGELLAKQADRDSVILALGGGTVGDAAGFVAATYMRGIDWISLPTTLLAQVDSGVGGKTGINHAAGKNLIGAFHQPALVICDTAFLKTLGPREMVSGCGEIVKYAIAFDPTFFKYLANNLAALLQGEPAVLAHAIARSLYWKGRLVSQDEYDRTGPREQLNFGHTFGHALEAATDYQAFQHGEAVILGMRFAAALSVQRGHLAAEIRDEIEAFLKLLPVPAIPAHLQPQDLFAFMQKDKKAAGGRVRFVLLERIGQTVSDAGVMPEDLLAAYNLMKESAP